MGNGDMARFWKDRWIGRDCLADLFPELFNHCRSKEATVAEFGLWSAEGWRWVEETEPLLHNSAELSRLAADLQQLLQPVSLLTRPDCWIWVPDSLCGFTVKKCYDLLLNLAAGGAAQQQAEIIGACKQIWKNDVPSKIQIFTWRVILHRVATRVELYRRGIIQSPNELSCGLCRSQEESVEHLFLSCEFAKKIWSSVFTWMGKSVNDADNIISHFLQFRKLVKGKKQKGVKQIIWMAVIWNIWLARNGVIFKGENVSIPSIVARIKNSAWSWFKARRGRSCGATWSDWYSCPVGCLEMV